MFLFSCKKDTEQPVDPASKVFCWLCTQHVSVNIISIQGGCGYSGFTWYDLPAVVCNMTEGGAKDYANSLKN